jgi:predicted MFS family arabinose efflux permease
MRAGSWLSIAGIYLFGVCSGSTVSKLIPLVHDIARVFGVGPADFGWLISLVALPAALLALPSGIVVDRIGPRVVLLAGAGLGVAANIVYLFAASLPLLYLARLLEGAAMVHIYTAGPAFLMATTRGARRTAAMTLWATYVPVGTATGLALGGLFADGGEWRMLFVASGALFALAGLLGLAQPTLPADERAAGPAVSLGDRLRALRGAYARPPLVLLALAFFLMVGLGLGANVAFPPYFARVHAVSIGVASNMVALATLAMVPGSLVAGVLLTRGVRRQRLFAGLGAIGFIAGALSFYPDMALSARAVVLTVWFLMSGAANATLLATLPVVAEPQRRGAAAALLNQAGALATFVNPPIWLALAAGRAWTPFAGLLALGLGLAVLAMGRLAARAGRAAA